MPKLTKRRIDTTKPKDKDIFLWCDATPGFGARIYPSGKVVFIAQVRVGRSQRRMKIGPYGPWTVEQAREEADEIIRAAGRGVDPQAQKREQRDAITISELCDEYMTAAKAGHVLTRFGRPKAQSTIIVDDGRIERHIKPLIGRLRARDITRVDVQRMVDDIAIGKTSGTFQSKKLRGKARVKGGAATAARVVELLGGIFTWAMKRGHMPDGINPVRGVERLRSRPRDRVLSPGELQALGAVLRDAQKTNTPAANAIELIALTGLRRQEAVGLRWAEIDQLGKCIRLAESKTGRSTRPLGDVALELLNERILKTNGTYVFPRGDGKGPAEVKKSIADHFNAAGLTDARAHDLRRTFASTAAEIGYGDGVIGELLGHAARDVTGRHYIRRPDRALVAAADETSKLILRRLNGEEEAETIDISGFQMKG